MMEMDPRQKDAHMPETSEAQYPDKRRYRRAKIAKPLRVRPSDPRDEHFEDLPVSINASKEGIYFHTRRSNYYKGMRLFITFPFASAHDPMNCEYVAEVVRVETLANGRFGVAVHLKLTMNYGGASSPGAITHS
jgi:PilZ domain